MHRSVSTLPWGKCCGFVCTGRKVVLRKWGQEVVGNGQGSVSPSRALEESRAQGGWHRGCGERPPQGTAQLTEHSSF